LYASSQGGSDRDSPPQEERPTEQPTDSPTPTPGQPTETEPPTETPTETEPPTETPTETEPPTETPTETPPGKYSDWKNFDTVVDAVAVGADPTGEQPVNFLFERYANDDTLLAFEPGTYKIDYFAVSDLTELGGGGIGDEPATLVPAAGNCRGGHPWVSFDGISDLHLENLTFDFRAVSRGGPIHLFLGGESVLRDVTCLGSCSNQISMLKVEVRDKRGAARFENFVARNSDDNQTLTGVYVGANHAGDLLLKDCSMERFSDNGLYASSPGGDGGGNGPVRVVGGNYRNNNISGVRLGTTGSRAQDVTVVVDSEVPGWGGLNARGIRLRNKSGQVIDNCRITFGKNAADSFGGIVCHQANGGALVKDTTITVDRASIPAIRTFPVETATDEILAVENCTIEGSAGAGVTAQIEGRDGTVFRNCTIEQRGTDRKGLHFIDSSNCRIVDSRIDVTEAPVMVENGTVTVENSTIVTPRGERHVDQTTLENETLDIS
jgi:hypothetical protein